MWVIVGTGSSFLFFLRFKTQCPHFPWPGVGKQANPILRTSSYEPPLTGLTRLPKQILLSVHMRNFSLFDRDKIWKTKTDLAQERCVVRNYRSFVDSCNFSNKYNSHTSEVEIHARQNYFILAALLRKQIYFVKKVLFRYRYEVFIWENI